MLNEFQEIKAVRYAFYGIRAGVLALILKALYSMYKACPKSGIFYVAAAAALILTAFCRVNAVIVIIICALTGLIFSFVAKKEKKK